MSTTRWLVTCCLCPLVALIFAVAICGLLIVSLAMELTQRDISHSEPA